MRYKSFWRVSAIFFMAVILFAWPVFSDQDLAKQAPKPVANMISQPFQNNTNFGIGKEEFHMILMLAVHDFKSLKKEDEK